MYAHADTEILVQRDREVQMAVNEFGKGAAFTSAVCPTALKNSRFCIAVFSGVPTVNILYCWYSENFNVEVHAYVGKRKYCINNTYEPQETTVYCGDGSSFSLKLEATRDQVVCSIWRGCM